ncbi:MAG TPA: hypothetical protein VF532_13480 [Candidatus Angelobacter sp.]
MTHTENNTQMEMDPVSAQEVCTSAAPNGAAVIISGPSCPVAFARWWAEYQEKVMKTLPARKNVITLEGRQ